MCNLCDIIDAWKRGDIMKTSTRFILLSVSLSILIMTAHYVPNIKKSYKMKERNSVKYVVIKNKKELDRCLNKEEPYCVYRNIVLETDTPVVEYYDDINERHRETKGEPIYEIKGLDLTYNFLGAGGYKNGFKGLAKRDQSKDKKEENLIAKSYPKTIKGNHLLIEKGKMKLRKEDPSKVSQTDKIKAYLEAVFQSVITGIVGGGFLTVIEEGIQRRYRFGRR